MRRFWIIISFCCLSQISGCAWLNNHMPAVPSEIKNLKVVDNKELRQKEVKEQISSVLHLSRPLITAPDDKKSAPPAPPLYTNALSQSDNIILFPKVKEPHLTPKSTELSRDKTKVKVQNFNFEDTEFSEIARVFLADILHVNYVIDPDIRGKVTIKFQGNMTRGEYFSLFQSLCEIYNASLVKSGNIYQIVPKKNLGQLTTRLRIGDGKSRMPGKEIITQVIKLRYIDNQQAVDFLRHFATNGGLIISPATGKMVIIVDTQDNINRLLGILKSIDVPFFNGKGIKTYNVKNLDAKSLALEMKKVVFALGGNMQNKKANLTFIPIQEANKLVVVTNTPEIFSQIDTVIKNIDHIDISGKTKIFFVKLQNVKSKDVQAVLNRLYIKKTSDIKRPDHIEIIADKDTNSLVIRATPRDFIKMKTIIDDLDARPLQAMFRIIIAEISLDNSHEFGIEWWMKAGNSEITAFPDTPLVSTNIFQASYVSLSDFYAMLKLVSATTNVNLLSSPHLLVRNGKEANVDIGQDVPMLKAQVSSASSTQVKDSIEYESTGIKMHILPTISNKGYVTLDLTQEISSASYSLPNMPKSPVIKKRIAKTSLVIQDGKTVVLAGIIQDSKEKKINKVPLLGDIPWLGTIFRSQSIQDKKVELLIAINVNIIHNQEEADIISSQIQRSMDTMNHTLPDLVQ